MPNRTILITGSEGNLGRKLIAHLDAVGGYVLKLVDRVPSADPRAHVADLTHHDCSWASLFADVDAVVHLAGDPKPQASWDAVLPANVDMSFNVFRAATQNQVRRVVYASSNFVVSGRRFSTGPLRSDQGPEPTNAYGASKTFSERLAKGFHEWHGLSIICLRIGFCQRKPGNQPGHHMRHGIWGQQMWLSDRDFCHAMERGILAEDVGFAILNVMSDNPGMRWDISQTRRLIGYAPQDGAAAQATPFLHALALWQRGVDAGIRTLTRVFGGVR